MDGYSLVVPTVANFGVQMGLLGTFSKVRHWDQKIFLSNLDIGALVYRFFIAEFDKEVFKINLKTRPTNRAYF